MPAGAVSVEIYFEIFGLILGLMKAPKPDLSLWLSALPDASRSPLLISPCVSEKHEVTGSSPVPGTSIGTQFFALREGCVLCVL
jgi:hypothetical protein